MNNNNKYLIVVSRTKKDFDNKRTLGTIVIDDDVSDDDLKKTIRALDKLKYFYKIYETGREVDKSEFERN